jgi:hypothetical protein
MSTWVGIAPLIGTGSLDGFAIGALASGACFMAVTAPRRARKRRAAAAGHSALISARSDWLCEHVVAAEAFPADEERLVPPEDPGVPDLGLTSPARRDARPGGGRHRLGDPIPGSAFPGQASGEGAMGAFPDGSLPAGSLPAGSLPAGTSRHAAFPDGALRGAASRGGAHRDAGPPDLDFPEGAFGNSKRPEARRLPRHAAPAVSLGSRVSSLVSGLIPGRALIGGAHG